MDKEKQSLPPKIFGLKHKINELLHTQQAANSGLVAAQLRSFMATCLDCRLLLWDVLVIRNDLA